MVPDREWRPAGENMDKRTARKVHAADFQRTLRELRSQYLQQMESRLRAGIEENDEANREAPGSDHMHVYVRKRPLLPHELRKHEFDVITAVGQREIVIHECKMYPDMRHKYVVSHHQRFSTCYDEKTGSGKTYTMSGLFHYISDDLFTEAVGDVDFAVSVSAVEVAGSNCFDLIHDRAKVLVCDDGEGNTGLVGTTEVGADSTNSLLEVLEGVKDLRTTESTTVNHQSSRSHLVCYVNLRHRSLKQGELGELYGQLVLLDLAGSERNEDSFYHDAARRKEAIEINKSHLALKECVRAIGREDNTGFVPYRASVLTRILKGCLWSMNSRASMLEDTPHVSTDRVDVKEAGEGEEERVIPIREWDNDRVRKWICSSSWGSSAEGISR
ncbi:hypothetical protein PF004_g2479 [Phytophthora fragariae]|uniref:Kinesin motor domain-containing protein n=1 Tax=Phytophthora fragariae TaxID=53985 RepID=A0A6G0PPE3_9STRA|nr:hypothetical protein PF004_g2479 [Phytophthora fragariae]